MRRFLLVVFLALAFVKNADASVSLEEDAAENSDSGAAAESIGGQIPCHLLHSNADLSKTAFHRDHSDDWRAGV